MKCLIMRFSDSNQRSGWGLFPALGKSSVTVEWVCKHTDSRVLEEAPINTFVLAWRDFKRSAVPALHSGHLINSHIQTRDISTSSLCPLQTDDLRCYPVHIQVPRPVRTLELRRLQAWFHWFHSDFWQHGKNSTSAVTGFCGGWIKQRRSAS